MLVARHEPEIAGTSDIVERFPDRPPVVESLTLEELKTLRARERIPELRPENARYDGEFEIPTFQEVIDLANELSEELGRPLGVYPETKHPERYAELGLELEPRLVEALSDNGLNEQDALVYVQSFSSASLREMAGSLRVPLVKLLRAEEPDLDEIAEYAHAIGPPKARVTEQLVEDAHATGLVVHPYTFRRENNFLPEDLRSSEDPTAVGDYRAEYDRYFAMGIDGVITDNPDLAREALA